VRECSRRPSRTTVAEARRCRAQFEFSEAQRHHVETLLDAWEREIERAP
jgi:hypothetical protein